ncbi:MAG: hypothetical protein ACI35S_06725 [Anaeroplasma sp.]
MLDFKNIKVYDLEESIIAANYAMMTKYNDVYHRVKALKFWFETTPNICKLILKWNKENKYIYKLDNTTLWLNEKDAFELRNNKNEIISHIPLCILSDIIDIFDKEKDEDKAFLLTKDSIKTLIDFYQIKNEVNGKINNDTYEAFYNRDILIECIKEVRRIINLANQEFCSGHRSALKGIMVSFDMKYTQYITKQFQRYQHFQYISSSSLMHNIVNMDLDASCAKYVAQESIDYLKRLIEAYNTAKNERWDKYTYTDRKGVKHKINGINEVLYNLYMQIIQNCPMGIELYVRVSTNYEQLAIIAKQRKFHTLKEDYGAFYKMVKSLPLGEELILNK